MSDLSLWVDRGVTAHEDVYYLLLKPRASQQPDSYMAVPRHQTLKPYVAHRPQEDRENWVAVGSYYSEAHDVVITSEGLAKLLSRVVEALLDQVAEEKERVIWRDTIINNAREELNHGA